MDLCCQGNVFAFQYAVKVCHSFPSKEQASFNFTAAVTIHSDFGAQEKKICHQFHFFLSICHEVMGLDSMILMFWMLSFKPAFSFSSFTLIKRLFSSSLFSAVKVVSSAYLRLLIFPPAILILGCDSSNLAFHLIYPAYKLNKWQYKWPYTAFSYSFPILIQLFHIRFWLLLLNPYTGFLGDR